MTRSILTILFGFFVFCLTAQNETFIKKLDICLDLHGHSIIETNDGYVIYTDNFGQNRCLGIIKIDKTGELVFEKIITSDVSIDTDFFNNFIQTDSGDFVFAATYRERGTWIQQVGFNLFSFDNPDTLITKLLPGTTVDQPTTIEQTVDGGFLIFVERSYVHTDTIDGRTYLDSVESVFFKLDSAGNFIDETILEDSNKFTRGKKMEILNSDEILVTYDGGRLSGGGDWHLSLMNSKFEKKWTNRIESESSNSLTCSSVGDSILLLGGGARLRDFSFGTQGYVFAYNYAGDLLWFQTLENKATYFSIIQLRVTESGDILGCGWHTNSVFDSISQRSSSTGRIFKLNNKGEILWDRDYLMKETRGGGILTDVRETSDGFIIATGDYVYDTDSEDPNGLKNDIIVMKLDSMGCLEPGCGDLVTVPTKNITNFQTDQSFTFSPNPTSGNLLLTSKNPITSSGKVIFYNALGQKIREQFVEKNDAEISIDLTGAAPGIYFAVFKTEEGQIDLGKVVVE